MSEATNLYAVKNVIRIIRNQRVILDSDLAKLYGVTTKALNQAVKRNSEKFPEDFMFQLDPQEITSPESLLLTSSASLRSQIVTLKNEASESQRGKHRKYLPYAFTEHGAIMAASILNSQPAVDMSVFIVRTFIRMREQLMSNAANAKRLAEIEKTLLTHDSAIVDLYEQIQPLLLPPPAPAPKRIGFGVKEKRASYRTRQRTRKKGAVQ